MIYDAPNTLSVDLWLFSSMWLVSYAVPNKAVAAKSLTNVDVESVTQYTSKKQNMSGVEATIRTSRGIVSVPVSKEAPGPTVCGGNG